MSLTLLACAQRTFAHHAPTDCFKIAPALLLGEFFDTNDDGTPDGPVDRAKMDGDVVLYQATLGFCGPGQCAYFGGAICIDPPGAQGCTDVTPAGGIPTICTDSTTCPPGSVASVDSNFVRYVVNHEDTNAPTPDADCAVGMEVGAVARYSGGTAHFCSTPGCTRDMGLPAANVPICNLVVTTTTSTSTSTSTLTSPTSTSTSTSSTSTSTLTSTTVPTGICRPPGFWGTHAGTEKSGSQNITQAVITACGGTLTICGHAITDTNCGDNMSAVEAICVSLVGNQTLQLARQLTAAALNCCITAGHSDCTGVSIHETFATCNDVCPTGTTSQVGDCISAIDCFNNGGVATNTPTGTICATGTCSDNGAPCNGGDFSPCADTSTATCVPNENSCRNQLLVNEVLGLHFEPPEPPGSPSKCQASRNNPCTLFAGRCTTAGCPPP